MVAVLAEVLNFTTMLSIFAKSPIWDDLNSEERLFEVWVFIEALVVVSTVGVNIIYVAGRSCQRESVQVDFEDHEHSSRDFNKDFLNSENNQLIINLFNQCAGPILVYALFADYFSKGGLTKKQHKMLFQQFFLQCTQVAAFVYLHAIPIEPNWSTCCRNLRKVTRFLSWFAAMLIFVFVPFVSIVHWFINFKVATEKDNVIKPWLFTYPMIGFFTLIYYYFIIRLQVLPELAEAAKPQELIWK